MNTKKIMGVFCALACAVNFGMITPAYAGIFGIMNAHQQEKWAEHLVKEEFNGTEPAGYSEDARRLTPIIHKLQNRIKKINHLLLFFYKFKSSALDITGIAGWQLP